jgi:hypothetical protein
MLLKMKLKKNIDIYNLKLIYFYTITSQIAGPIFL